MHRRLRRASVALFATAGLAMPLAATSPANAAPAPVVVTSGLNNPRQLSLTDDGVLVVAEAGNGGNASHCVTGPEGPTCIGLTGSIDAITNPAGAHNVAPNRVITGLLSGAGPDGSAATGSDGVSDRHFNGGTMFIQDTFFPPAAFPSGVSQAQNGKLLYASPHGTPHVASDISAFEKANDPDKHGFDSDPYYVLDLGDHRLVADAAANDILSVDSKGHISVFHVFPNVTTKTCTTASSDFPGFDPTPAFPGCNFVPTSLAAFPDGDIVVGGLSSLIPGQAEVVVLSKDGKSVEHGYNGFSGVTGVATGLDGNIYVSQIFGNEHNPPNPAIQGVVTRIHPNGAMDNLDVPFPAGLAVDRGNNVYVSAWSIAPSVGIAPPGSTTPLPGSSGQVWKLRF